MLRSFMITPVLAIGLATSALAQHVTDQDAWQAGESVVQAHNKASQAKDAAGVAALYAEDATYNTPDGPVSGRAAIQKVYAEDFKFLTPEPAKLERVVMLGDTIRLRSGRWSALLQSANGPVHLQGYWATTDVLDGGTWKIRMETYNVTMPPPASEPGK